MLPPSATPALTMPPTSTHRAYCSSSLLWHTKLSWLFAVTAGVCDDRTYAFVPNELASSLRRLVIRSRKPDKAHVVV